MQPRLWRTSLVVGKGNNLKSEPVCAIRAARKSQACTSPTQGLDDEACAIAGATARTRDTSGEANERAKRGAEEESAFVVVVFSLGSGCLALGQIMRGDVLGGGDHLHNAIITVSTVVPFTCGY